MPELAIFVVGLALGVFWRELVRIFVGARRRLRALPPASRRQLDRAARANRADIRRAQHDRRNWLPPSTEDFDHEETR